MKLTLHEIAKVVGAKNDVTAYKDVALNQIEFDSRKITAGDLFLPLKGARDGHDFIQTAFDNGAIATFTEKELPADQAHILVDDALEAFQELAAYYLEKTGVDVIAVTGSNGKTTTKDMIHDILATTYRTYKTQGNYNNEIGLPYTALHMPDDTEKIVLEMGQDHMGDIHLLSNLAKPKTAVVTLIGEAHLEFFGSRDKIAQGKMQMQDGMPDGSLLLVPCDPIVDPFLPSNLEVVRFGDGAELTVSELTEYKDHLTFSTKFLDGHLYLLKNLPILFNQHDIGMIIGDADLGIGIPLIQSYDDIKGNAVIHMLHPDFRVIQEFLHLSGFIWRNFCNHLQFFVRISRNNSRCCRCRNALQMIRVRHDD